MLNDYKRTAEQRILITKKYMITEFFLYWFLVLCCGYKSKVIVTNYENVSAFNEHVGNDLSN